jgi:hypothetical protein
MPIRATTPASLAVDLPGLDCVGAPWSSRGAGIALRAGAGAGFALAERTHPPDLVRAAMPTAHRRPLRARRFRHTQEETC